MSPDHICEVLAQYTPQIHFYSLLKLPLLGCEPKHAVLSVAPGEEGRASRAPAPVLAVLAFANKHYTINTSLLSLQKTTRFQSQSSDYTVHNKFAFMNYTDGEHGGIKITT